LFKIRALRLPYLLVDFLIHLINGDYKIKFADAVLCQPNISYLMEELLLVFISHPINRQISPKLAFLIA
jgi:hypothetical protein